MVVGPRIDLLAGLLSDGIDVMNWMERCGFVVGNWSLVTDWQKRKVCCSCIGRVGLLRI